MKYFRAFLLVIFEPMADSIAWSFTPSQLAATVIFYGLIFLGLICLILSLFQYWERR